MSHLPLLSYKELIRILQKLGFVVVRQKGSHIRLHKNTLIKNIKITIPARKPIKKATLNAILKQAEIDIKEFIKLL